MLDTKYLTPESAVDHANITLFTLTNESGATIKVSNYGARLVSVLVPDRYGKLGEVVLGYPDLKAYLNDKHYLGATIGRMANRITKAKFELNNTTYLLDKNDGYNSNHGGFNGFDGKIFAHELTSNQVAFSCSAKDGESGYPGNLQVSVIYQFANNNELLITYKAKSDQDTLVGLTNHAYFNLSGRTEKIFNHRLFIDSRQMLEMNTAHLPTGKIIPTEAFTFLGQQINEVIDTAKTKIIGLNNYYILDKKTHELSLAAILSHPETGRALEIRTTNPGLMCYTADFLNGSALGHHHANYSPFDGICLECQPFPDAPNHANFPSALLKKENVYQQQISYKFTITPL